MITYWDAHQLEFHVLSEHWDLETLEEPGIKKFTRKRTTQNNSPALPQEPNSRQWTWQGFTFAHDIGSPGAQVVKPGLVLFGWLLALVRFPKTVDVSLSQTVIDRIGTQTDEQY